MGKVRLVGGVAVCRGETVLHPDRDDDTQAPHPGDRPPDTVREQPQLLSQTILSRSRIGNGRHRRPGPPIRCQNPFSLKSGTGHVLEMVGFTRFRAQVSQATQEPRLLGRGLPRQQRVRRPPQKYPSHGRAAHRSLPDDSEPVQAMAVLARAQQDAVGNRTQAGDKFRSHLREYFPGFLAAFRHAREGLGLPVARRPGGCSHPGPRRQAHPSPAAVAAEESRPPARHRRRGRPAPRGIPAPSDAATTPSRTGHGMPAPRVAAAT